MRSTVWREVAESPNLTGIAGPRVRFQCLDANHKHVVLGANTGSLYVFARTRADGPSPFGPDADAPEGPLRFMTVVSPPRQPSDDAAKDDPADDARTPQSAFASRSRGVSPAIRRIKLSPRGDRCAIAYATGVLNVVEFRPGVERRGGSPKVIVQIPKAHVTADVTWLEWSPDGTRLLSGDDKGRVGVTEFSKGAVVANTLALGSPVAQASFSASGLMAALCTNEAVDLLSVPTGVHPKVGSKPREGPYGGCFHVLARDAAPDGATPRNSGEGESEWMLAARPGRRLWVAEAWLEGGEGARGEPRSAVAATLKPDVPKGSRAPGAPEPRPGAKSRKWEFGRLHPLGPTCVLSVAERALAVVEVCGGSLLEWCPLGEPGSVGIAAGVASAAAVDARAFLLAAPEHGGGVWCLEAPPTEAALVACVADVAAVAVAVARERDGAGGDTGSAETLHAVTLATKLRVPETRLLEDARALVEDVAARRAVAGGKVSDDGDDDFVDIDAELATAVEAYERFYAEAVGDAPPPPPRPSLNERTTVSSPPGPPKPTVPPSAAALSRSSSFASSAGASLSRGDSGLDATIVGAGEFPAAESGKFFFYNPNANAGERKEKKRDKEEKKKKKSAKVVDVGDGTAPVDAPKPKRDKPKKSPPAPKPIAETSPTNEDKKTAADMGSIVARLEEDRDDYLAAVKALSDLGEAPPVSPPPFLHWTEYREIPAPVDVGSAAAAAAAKSTTGKRREALRRARERRVDAAAAAARALRLSRRSLDASPLIPALRRWRLARAECDEIADEIDDGGEFGGGDETHATRQLSDSTQLAREDMFEVLARVERELDVAVVELGLAGYIEPAERKVGEAAARVVAKADAAETAARTTKGTIVEPADDKAQESMDEPFDGDLGALAGSLVGALSLGEEERVERILRAIPPEDGDIVAVESFRRALVDLLGRPDSAQPLESLESVTTVVAAALGAENALKALEIAVEDEAIEKKIGCDALETFAGNVFADAITCVTLDLVAAVGDERDRGRAASRILRPLEARVSDPPPSPVGRFPQLRAAIAAEASLKASPGDDAAMRRLPFVKKERGRWELAVTHTKPIEPTLEDPTGGWGVRVPLSTACCARCALPLREIRWSGDAGRSSLGRLVTFPCGHTLHECCAIEDACVECAASNAKPLRSPAFITLSAAINAELESL